MTAPDEPRPDEPELSQEELEALLMPRDGGQSDMVDPLDLLLSPKSSAEAPPESEPAPIRPPDDESIAEAEPPPGAPEPASMESEAPGDTGDIELDKATLDALLVESGMEPSETAAGLDENLDDTDMDAPIEAGALDDGLDALISSASGDDAPVDAHPHDAVPDEEVAAPLGVSDSEIDSLVRESAADDDVGDENLAAASDSAAESLLDGDALNALIDQAVHDARDEQPAPPADQEDLIEAPAFEPDAEDAGHDPFEAPVPPPGVDAGVAIESLVAHEAARAAHPPADTHEAPAPDVEARVDDGEPAPPRWQPPRIRFRWPRLPSIKDSLRGTGAYLQRSALRMATAFSAGMVVTMATFTLLLTNQVRELPPGELAALQAPTLAEALAMARASIDDGHFSDALAVLDGALARTPESPGRTDAVFLRIQALYRAIGTYATDRERMAFHGEVDEFERNHPGDPRLARALAWQAEVYEREGHPYDARRNYRKIETNHPQYDDMAGVLLASARLSLAINQPDDALASLEHLMRSYPGAPSAGEARLLLAGAYAARGERQRARDLLESIARTQGHTGLGAAATARLARLAFEDGRYEDAIEMLENRRRRATTVDGNDEVYLLLAHAYRDAGMAAEAERVLRELIDFFPDTPLMPQAYLALSNLLERGGRREDALRLARLALERFENDRDVMLNAADLFERAGKPLEAAELYMQAEAMERGSPDLLLRAGRAFLDANQPDNALATLGAIADAFPGTPEAIAAGIEWSRASHYAGNPEAAMTRLRSLRDRTLGEPAQVPVLLTMAEIYRDLGLRQPLAEVQREVAALTNEPQRIAEAAIDMIREGLYEPGFAAAEAVALDSVRPATAYALMMAHAEALLCSDAERAVAMMERALADFPAYRTPQGDRLLFDAYLATEQPALARVMLADLEDQARRDPLLNEGAQELAVTLGDYHYRRGDYRAALEAYAKVADAPYAAEAHRGWASFQRANALVRIREYDDAVEAYEAVITGGSEWANEAELRLGLLQIERRLRTGRRAEEAAR